MFVSNVAAPYTLQITFQKLWLANSSKGVLKNIFQQLCYTFHNTLVAR